MLAAFGAHSGYILASYAAGILILGWMILRTWRGHRAAQARLARLESHKQ